jgi:hypothetical protein
MQSLIVDVYIYFFNPGLEFLFGLVYHVFFHTSTTYLFIITTYFQEKCLLCLF